MENKRGRFKQTDRFRRLSERIQESEESTISYRLESGESLPSGIKRIATEQIDQALDQLENVPEGRDEAVHDARKRFKKIRAVLRLVRDEVGEEIYQRENVCYRDAGRRLSDVRDSYVMVETIDNLTGRFADQLVPGAFADLRDKLMAEHDTFKHKILDHEEAGTEVIETIQSARERVENWPIEQDSFSAIRPGLKRVYKRGRNRLAEAYADPAAENFHEWRKRVKYLWYHTRILEPVWPDLFDELADQVHDLSDYLGDDHDLAELRRLLTDRPDLVSDKEERQALVGLLDRRSAELRAAARPLGQRIYTEKPKDFVGRVGQYWQAWQEQ